MDLSDLDGVTVAGDYAQALLEFDRGYATSHKPTPTDKHAIGVAMTLSALRNGQLKSHIFLNGAAVADLESMDNPHYQLALHTLSHECAHVTATASFDRAFPNFLLRTAHTQILDAFRWQVILACWDEFAATYIAAPYGQDPTQAYEETFLKVLAATREEADTAITAYFEHGDLDRILGEVYGIYGNLMKFAAYHLGNLAGQGIQPEDRAAVVSALEGHWFSPFFERLRAACEAILSDFGQWETKEPFLVIGAIVDDLVDQGGMRITPVASGGFNVSFS
jgi:hypothetical protein